MAGTADLKLVTASLDVRKAVTPQRETTDGIDGPPRAQRDGSLVMSPYVWALAKEGRVFIAADSDHAAVLTTQTAYADTTPALLLDVPKGCTAIPLGVFLSQDGTAAGGEILVHIEIDEVVRYASGGAREKVRSSRTDMPLKNQCDVWSEATAVAGAGIQLYAGNFINSVAPEVADDINWHQFLWVPDVPIFLVGAAALNVYAYATDPGPEYYWYVMWAEIPSSDLN